MLEAGFEEVGRLKEEGGEGARGEAGGEMGKVGDAAGLCGGWGSGEGRREGGVVRCPL